MSLFFSLDLSQLFKILFFYFLLQMEHKRSTLVEKKSTQTMVTIWKRFFLSKISRPSGLMKWFEQQAHDHLRYDWASFLSGSISMFYMRQNETMRTTKTTKTTTTTITTFNSYLRRRKWLEKIRSKSIRWWWWWWLEDRFRKDSGTNIIPKLIEDRIQT